MAKFEREAKRRNVDDLLMGYIAYFRVLNFGKYGSKIDRLSGLVKGRWLNLSRSEVKLCDFWIEQVAKETLAERGASACRVRRGCGNRVAGFLAAPDKEPEGLQSQVDKVRAAASVHTAMPALTPAR